MDFFEYFKIIKMEALSPVEVEELNLKYPGYRHLIANIIAISQDDNTHSNDLHLSTTKEELVYNICCTLGEKHSVEIELLVKESVLYLSNQQCLGMFYLFTTEYIKRFPACIDMVIALVNTYYPDNHEMYFNIAHFYKSKNSPQFAIDFYKKAIRIKPGHIESIYYLAETLAVLGDVSKAEQLYKLLLQLSPELPEPYFNLGNIYREQGKYEESIQHVHTAIKLKPDFTAAYLLLGLVLETAKHIEEAITCYETLIEVDPSFYEGYNALGLAYKNVGKYDLSKQVFLKSISLFPNIPKLYGNLANVLNDNSEYSESLAYYDKAIQLEPNYQEARFSRSLVHLLLGEYDKGWVDYDQRWNLPYFEMRNYSKPLWSGQQSSGITLLVWAEQGFGDTIHFCRFIKLIDLKKMTVIFECQPELIDTLQTFSPNIEIRPLHSVTDDEFDYHIPLLGLPGMFKTNLSNIPGTLPYLKAPDAYVEKISKKINFDNKFTNIGIVWSGNTKHKNDHNRSCHPKYFSGFQQAGDIKLFSLHLSNENLILAKDDHGFIEDLSDYIKNFSDTASIIEKLDAIISVDTAVAHLAGALGKPIFLILPYVPEWRWMLDRDTSPWYPTMKIFRQKTFGDWQQVLDDVLVELK